MIMLSSFAKIYIPNHYITKFIACSYQSQNLRMGNKIGGISIRYNQSTYDI